MTAMTTTASTAAPTDADASDTDCVAGDEDCPGPDGDDLPCWPCFRAAACPAGRSDCDGPHRRPDHSGRRCRRCALKVAGPL